MTDGRSEKKNPLTEDERRVFIGEFSLNTRPNMDKERITFKYSKKVTILLT